MQKCIATVANVAPATEHHQRHNSCDQRLAPQLIFIARDGRCGGLELISFIARLWTGNTAVLPHIADPPGDQIVDC